MAGNSSKAVIAACLANLGICVAKAIGFALTGAGSMLAEAVHSFADAGNQALLLWGGARAARSASSEHPFGYARERYFWAFVVALVIFLLGSVFALYEGISKLGHPHPLSAPAIAVGILLVGVLLEGWSFKTALAEALTLKADRPWRVFLKDTKSAELPVVLLEDFGALVGLAIALAGVSLTQITGNPIFDAWATIAIGLLLGVIALFLSLEMHSLLIGESASGEHLALIREAIAERGDLRLVHLRTMHLGPDELLVAMKVSFDPDLSFTELTGTIDELESGVRRRVPAARYIYVEPDRFKDAPANA